MMGSMVQRDYPERKRRKPLKKDILKVNRWNKTKRCQMRLLEYFEKDDLASYMDIQG